MMFPRMLLTAMLLALPASAFAQSTVALEDRPGDPVAAGLYGPVDMAPESPLYSLPVEVAPGVFSAIGATQPPTYENAGHNNNLSFVIGEKGVLVVNGGASAQLAKALHEEIKARTDLPVLYAVPENGQGHAMLGLSYWNDQGVTVIAQEEAAEVFLGEAEEILANMQRYNRDRAQGTHIPYIDETFEEHRALDLGGLTVELVVFGPAHSPGDMSVVIPDRNVIIAGDMAFHTRMPPIFEETDTAGWLESWALFSEAAADKIVIPGHGAPTDLATVDAGTRVYIEYLREKVGEILDNGGTLQDAYEIDQSQFSDWHTYWELAARNAGRVYQQMEFE
ncbi:MAG: MBL fold metallo-hydrolase [Neomegalonema sp.]|nr:MBL fold metallo-hydrolase [Neomegalonema sp.]